jgi:hypothetical protein
LQASLCVLQTQTLPDVENTMNEDSSDLIMRAFPVVGCPGFMVVIPSFMLLSTAFNNQRFGNCSPTVEVGFVKLMS